MPFTTTNILYGFLAPLAAAFVAALAVRRLTPAGFGERYASSLAFAGAFVVGYWLLGLGPWAPAAHWHWLPYAVLLAAILGPSASAAGIGACERVAIYTVAALVAAWHLAPTWPDVAPSRPVQIAVWTALVVVMSSMLFPLARLLPAATLPAVLSLSCVCGAVVLILSGSLRFGQIAGNGAGGLFGVAAAAALARSRPSTEPLAFPATVFLCGAMWIGQANSFSEVPLASYVLVSLSPILLWACAVGPVARLGGAKQSVVVVGVGLALAAVAIALALSA